MIAAEQRWVGETPQVVFEDAHLRVMFQPGGSDMLLLTFGDAVVLADGTRFFADTVAGRFGINCLGFMARAPYWYPADSMRAAARAVAYTLAAFDIRIGYGSSMGAYAAIKYSALLGATHVVAFCPQWSIDPAECGADESGYRDFFRPHMAGMGITAADLAGAITVFHDPGQPNDAAHFRRLTALCPDVRACRVHHVAHELAPVLAGSRLATDLFRACFLGDEAGLYALVNPPRRASVQRRRHLLAASAVRHPLLTLAALRQVIRAGQALQMDGARCVLPLYRALIAGGHAGLAEALVGELLPHIGEGRARLIRAGAATSPILTAGQLPAGGLSPGGRPMLRAVHGTVLCYSALGGCLTHVAWPPADPVTPGLQPVHVDGAWLAVHAGAETYRCRAVDVHATDLVPAGASTPAGCYEALQAGPGAFHLRAAGIYAMPARDGTVWRHSPHPSDWEVFTQTDTEDPGGHDV